MRQKKEARTTKKNRARTQIKMLTSNPTLRAQKTFPRQNHLRLRGFMLRSPCESLRQAVVSTHYKPLRSFDHERRALNRPPHKSSCLKNRAGNRHPLAV